MGEEESQGELMGFSKEVLERALELGAKMSIHDVRAQLRLEGLAVPSVGWLSKALNTGPNPKAGKRVAPNGSGLVPPTDSEQREKSLALLYRQRDLCKDALDDAEGDPGALSKVGRALNTVVAQIRQLEADGADDGKIVENVDWVEAAKTGREKLHELLSKAIAKVNGE